MRHQPLRPALERRGLGRQADRGAARELLISGVQILEQNTPRHAVDHQVVDDEEQPLPAHAEIEQGGLRQRSARDVEAGLALLHFIGELVRLYRRLDLGQIDMGKPNITHIDIGLMPRAIFAVEPQSQGVVVVDHVPDRLRHESRREPAAFQQYRLVEVARIVKILLEEPVLNWRERHLALRQVLIHGRRR